MDLVKIKKNTLIILEGLQISEFRLFDAPKNRIAKIIQGYLEPIRKMPEDESKKITAILLCEYARLYCGAKDDVNPIEVYQHGALFVIKSFSQIGSIELEEAFTMAAANKFEGIDIKAYGGIFSIAMLGDILSAYLHYRNGILKKYLELKEKKEKEEEAPKGAELDLLNLMAINDFVEQVENEIERIQSGLMPKWRDWERVPAILAEKALKSNKIIIDKDFKKSIFEKAKEIAKIEVNYDSRNIKSQNRGLARKLIDAQFQIESPYFNNKIETIYAKLLIFEFIQSHKHETI